MNLHLSPHHAKQSIGGVGGCGDMVMVMVMTMGMVVIVVITDVVVVAMDMMME